MPYLADCSRMRIEVDRVVVPLKSVVPPEITIVKKNLVVLKLKL